MKPNGDGTNPQKRFEEFVKVMYEEGIFEYSWNPNVYFAVKDYLSQKGLICWKDRRYFVGRMKQDGTKDGVATKGKAEEQLAERVLAVVRPKEEEQEEQGLPHALVYRPLSGPNEHHRPLRVMTDPRHLDWYSGGPPDWYEGLRDRRMTDFALAA